MKLIVGLGNPGHLYASSRHNVGFRIVERFAGRHGIDLTGRRFAGRFGRGRVNRLDVAILEPETYMNLCGSAVQEAVRALPLHDPSADLIVVLDDVDLPFGQLRVRPAGGAGGHRGLRDLLDRLGHGDFARLRFGVGRPPPDTDTADYVLTPFSAAEEAALEVRLEQAADALDGILTDGIEAAMNRYNAPASALPESS